RHSTRALPHLGEAVHRVEQLLGLRLSLGLITGSKRAGDAVLDVVVEDPEAEAFERGCDGADLGEDVDAVAILGDHLLDPPYLAFDSVQALDEGALLLVVSVVPGGCFDGAHQMAPSRVLWKRRSRRLFETTNRLEAAIAAAAMIGFKRPATASGIAATL